MENTEEEILIYLEFSGMLHEDLFNEPNLVFKTLGFETENPILQIGEEIYEGEYDYAKGTNLFFEDDPTHSKQGDPVFAKQVNKPVKYICKTNKILKMNRIFLKEKKKTNSRKKKTEEELDNEKLQLSETYEEALEKISEIAINRDSNKQETENNDS